MPALIFPAPGCADGQRFPDTLLGFDILSSSGGTFVNLLRNSNDLTKSSWIKGSAAGPTTANYDIVDWYINDADPLPINDIYVLSNGYGDNLIITSTSTSYIGQLLTVSSNTRYTASFFAKRGTATNMSYGVYDRTNSTTIVSPTSYYNQTTSTYTKISFSFITNSSTSEIVFYPLWTITSGNPGSVNIAAPQVEAGNTATGYNSTLDISFAALGIPSVVKQSYGITRLSTFSDPAINFDSISINGQSKVKWNVVNDYIYDSNFLTYSSRTGNNVLDITDFANRPYNVGDTVTISNDSPVYRQNFTVTSFTPTTITINTTATIPYNGALLTNPTPSVYPAALEYVNLVTYKKGVTQITKGRQALYLSTLTPNSRAVTYSFENKQFADLKFSSMGNTKSLDRLKQTLIDYQPGKVNPLNFFKEVVPNRLPSNIRIFKTEARTTPRENRPAKLTSVIRPREIAPSRLPNVIQNFTTATGFLGPNPVASYPSGIYKLSYQYLNGTVLIIDPSFLPGGIISAPQFENIYRLESFDNQGVYVGPAVGVSGTDNIKPFDAVGDYINDYAFTASTYVFPYPGYLYFNPEQTNSLQRTQFPLGSYVKLSNTFTGYSEVTMVLESNLNNIFVTLAPEFPNNYIGGTTIQDASPFYYPKEKVVQDIGHVQLPIENVELARENLFYSEYMPSIPGRPVVYAIDRAIGNDTIDLSRHINRMETFQDSALPGDFLLPVTGQNTEVRYGVVSWYTDESDVLAKTSATSIVKTIYFPIQGATVYASSSTIRIKNASINYDKTFSVITGTNYSVTILDPDDFPTGSVTTIEKAESSVYQQQYVKTTTRPTNARENLYYFNLAQGYRYNSTVGNGVTFTSNIVDITVPKVSSVTKLITSPRLLTVDKLTASIKIKGIPTVVSTSTFLNVIASATSQTNVRTLLRPVTPAERLFYFNMAPGYLNNSTYSYGKTLATDNTVGTSTVGKLRAASKVSGDTVRLQTGKASSISALRGDRVATLYPGVMQPVKFKFDTNQLFFTPRSGNLAKPIVRLTSGVESIINSGNLAKQIAKLTASYEGLPVQFLVKPIQVLKSDRVIINVGKALNVSLLKSDNTRISADKIAQFTVKSNTVQMFNTPTSGKMQSAIVVKDTRSNVQQGALKFAFTVKDINSIVKTGLINNPILRLSDIANRYQFGAIENPIKFLNNQLFFAPSFGKLSSSAKLADIIATNTIAQLSKQIAVIKDTNVIGSNVIAQLSKQIAVMKDTRSNVQQGNLKFAVTVKDQVYNIAAGIIQPIKFLNNQLFFAPSFGKLSSSAKLADIIATNTIAQLSKQIAVIKDTNGRVQSGTLKFVATVKDQVYNIKVGGIEQNIRFRNNQVFFVPASLGKTDSINKIKADGNRLDVPKLSVTNKFKDVPQRIEPGAITKFKFSVLYSQVFYAPQFGKTATVNKIKADGNRLTIGKVTSSSRLASPNNRYYDTGITDNYFDQTNYAAITVPNSPAAWYRYFNIAPGFRANLTYSQGRAFAPDQSTIKSDRLSTFDNEGLVTDPYLEVTGSTDPIVAVTGRTNQFTNNVALWYIDDRDVLTLLPIGSETLTLYFRIMSWTATPFAAGQRVKITSNTNGYVGYVTILSADASSVTIIEPIGFPSISDMTIQHVQHTDSVTVYFTPQLNKIPYPVGSYVRITNNANASYITVLVEDSGLDYVTFTKPNLEFALPAYGSGTIASASIAVYPKDRVSTQVAPTRPRESLYYAELARGYKYGVINTPFGSSISENGQLTNTVSFLNRDSIKLTGLLDNIDVGQLRKQLFELRLPTDSQRLITFVNRFKLEADRVHEIQLGASNGVIRILKTGDYKKGSNGIIDVAAPKKEPIQFWN